MKEYGMSESMKKKNRIFTGILMSAALIFIFGIMISTDIKKGVDVKEIIIKNTLYLIVALALLFIKIRIGDRRLNKVRLIFDEDFLIFSSYYYGNFKIRYSDIYQVYINFLNGIVIELKYSYEKKYLPKCIENYDEVFELLQMKANENIRQA